MMFDIEDSSQGPCLSLRGHWSQDARTRMMESGINCLALDRLDGWIGTDLAFLHEIPWLETLYAFIGDIADVSPIASLSNLRFLILAARWRSFSDLSTLHCLQKCELDWGGPGAETFLRCPQIRDLTLRSLVSEATDFSYLHALEALSLGDSRAISSMPTLPNPCSLRSLCIHDLPRLTTLDSVSPFIRLESLELRQCRNVTSIAPVAGICTLQELDISQNGQIESLKPLENHPSLCKIWFTGSTMIADGDLGPLRRLPKLRGVWFDDRRRYNYSFADFPHDDETC